MSKRLKTHSDALRFLTKCSPRQRKAFLERADKELINCICECVANVLKGHVKLRPSEKRKLVPLKTKLRHVMNKKLAHKKRKRIIVQNGGFAGVLLGPLLRTLAGILLK